MLDARTNLGIQVIDEVKSILGIKYIARLFRVMYA